jgi:hypothetical protein
LVTTVAAYEEHEIRAWRDLAEAAAERMLSGHIPTGEGGDLFLTASPGCSVYPFNRTLGLGCRGPVTAEAIANVTAWYEERGIDSFWLQLGKEAAPGDVKKWLGPGRFAHSYVSVLLACRRPSSVTIARSSLEIRRIGEESAAVFGRVAAKAFRWPSAAEELAASTVGRDGWHHYLAYDGSTAVGCGAAYYSDGLAWIGFAGVISSHRRSGCHAQLISHRIADAFQLCDTVIVDTAEGSASFRNCLRAGFEPVASRAVYAYAKRRFL